MTMMTDKCAASTGNFNEIVQIAIELPTLEEALAYVCVWENERVIKHLKDKPNVEWDTFFKYILTETTQRYLQHHQLSLISLKDTLK